MRTLFVVQRYGEHIAGGSEQCCRLFAEQMAARGHDVDVATSCAKNYTDWENEFPAGTERINDVLVHRHPVDRPRLGEGFSALDAAVVWGRHPTPLATQERWAAEMGPRTTELPGWLAYSAGRLHLLVHAAVQQQSVL